MGENLKTPMEAATARLKSLREITMPNQPKFCVVPVEPSEYMLEFAQGAFSGASKSKPLARKIYSAMIAATGPEAEAHIAVPRELLTVAADGLDEAAQREKGPGVYSPTAQALRALLSTAK